MKIASSPLTLTSVHNPEAGGQETLQSPVSKPASRRRIASGTNRKSKHIISFQTPAWIPTKLWMMKLEFQISNYNIIPHDAPIIQCMRQNDLDGMRNIFEQRQVSVFDRCYNGETLLVVCSKECYDDNRLTLIPSWGRHLVSCQ